MSKRRTKSANVQADKPNNPVMTMDSFQNAMARLGFQMPNMLEATTYPLTRLTQDYQTLNSLYRNHWIVRKIVDVIPEDMCKNWIKLNTQIDPGSMTRLEKVIKKTKTKERILEGLKWGRLYGGAVGVILIEGQEDMLAQPLNYDLIMPGSYKGLLILDRWSGISPEAEVISDINDPDFGLPAYYQMTMPNGRMLRVHHSRLVRFIGNALPLWESWAEQQWGASVVEAVYDELKKRDNTSYNIANLVFLANLRIYQTDMADLMGLGDPKIRQDFWSAMQAINMMMNNQGMTIIGQNDSFDTKQYTFTGLNDVYESFMLDVAGACEIPVTRLFGRSPAGFNATGESDLTNYYDSIEEKQEAYLSPVLDKLLPIIALSTWGMIPDDLDYEYNPLRKADPKENADLAKSMGESVISVYNASLISQQTALKELRQQSEVTGMWSNITDEDIAKADTEVDMGGELEGLAGMLPQMGQSQQDYTGDAQWREEEHPRRKDGKFGEGGGSGESSKSSKPQHLETIDFNDKKMVQSTLEKYETQIVGQEYETAIVITPDGKVHRVDGEATEVHPEIVGDLEGAYMTHNHPEDETWYSFSPEDVTMLLEGKCAHIRGVDHLYVYEMERTQETVDSTKQVIVGEFNSMYVEAASECRDQGLDMDEFSYHIRIKRLAEKYKFKYRRKSNG